MSDSPWPKVPDVVWIFVLILLACLGISMYRHFESAPAGPSAVVAASRGGRSVASKGGANAAEEGHRRFVILRTCLHHGEHTALIRLAAALVAGEYRHTTVELAKNMIPGVPETDPERMAEWIVAHYADLHYDRGQNKFESSARSAGTATTTHS